MRKPPQFWHGIAWKGLSQRKQVPSALVWSRRVTDRFRMTLAESSTPIGTCAAELAPWPMAACPRPEQKRPIRMDRT